MKDVGLRYDFDMAMPNVDIYLHYRLMYGLIEMLINSIVYTVYLYSGSSDTICFEFGINIVVSNIEMILIIVRYFRTIKKKCGKKYFPKEQL